MYLFVSGWAAAVRYNYTSVLANLYTSMPECTPATHPLSSVPV